MTVFFVILFRGIDKHGFLHHLEPFIFHLVRFNFNVRWPTVQPSMDMSLGNLINQNNWRKNLKIERYYKGNVSIFSKNCHKNSNSFSIYMNMEMIRESKLPIFFQYRYSVFVGIEISIPVLIPVFRKLQNWPKKGSQTSTRTGIM